MYPYIYRNVFTELEYYEGKWNNFVFHQKDEQKKKKKRFSLMPDVVHKSTKNIDILSCSVIVWYGWIPHI